MKRALFILFFISVSLCLCHFASAKDSIKRPRLVVGIVVDQMRYDYLYRYYEKYSEGGFKKIMNQGYNCRNTKYNYVPTYTAPGHAAVYTGTVPSVNGIVGNEWFDRYQGRTVYCVEDKEVATVGDTTAKSGKFSPKNLFSTTVGDELKIATNFRSKVIGIALKDRGSILPAGFTGQAYWYNDATGNWITSTYYQKDLPSWVKAFNEKKYSDQILKQTWTTLLDIKEYTESTVDDMPYELGFGDPIKSYFPYDLNKLKGNSYGMVRATPFGNTLTKDFALEALKNEQLGKDEFTDLLAVSFSSTDYVGHQFGPNSIEVEDTYIRLDRDLEEMIKTIEATVGKENVLFFLTADHGAVSSPGFLKQNKIPSGVFNEKKMLDSLNKFLGNTFKAYSLISYYTNQQIYLNYSELEKYNIQTKELQERICAFLLQFEGIANVTASVNLKYISSPSGWEKMIKNGYNPKRSGDIVLSFKPGWLEGRQKGTTHSESYVYDTHVPLLWYGWIIKNGETSSSVDITDIAPTLSNLLSISFPNGSIGNPIQFK